MSWDEVEDQITMPRYRALCRYWAEHPPLHKIAAAMAGIEPSTQNKQYASPEEMFGDGFG